MNCEKIEDRRKGSNIFRFHGYMYKKIMNAKIKLTCGMFSTKKTSGTAFIEFGMRKKIRKILKMTCPLRPPTIPSNALKSNAMKMRQSIQNVARVSWRKLIFVRNQVGICIEEECLKCHTKIDSKFAIFFQL